MGGVARLHHRRDVGFSVLNGRFESPGRAEFSICNPFTGVLPCGRPRSQVVQESVAAQRGCAVKSGARCIAGRVKSGEPTRPRADDAATVSVNGQTAHGVDDGGFEGDGLSVHVDARALLDEADERPPPRSALAELPRIEDRLNGGGNSLIDLNHRAVCRLDGCS